MREHKHFFQAKWLTNKNEFDLKSQKTDVSGTVFKSILGPLFVRDHVFCQYRHTLHVLLSIRFRRDGDRQTHQNHIFRQTHDFCVRKVSNYFSLLSTLFFICVFLLLKNYIHVLLFHYFYPCFKTPKVLSTSRQRWFEERFSTDASKFNPSFSGEKMILFLEVLHLSQL